MVSKGTNRLTRDNSGRITSVGGDGATVRGGRLKTASGKQRETQVARLQGAGGRLRGGRSKVEAAQKTITAKKQIQSKRPKDTLRYRDNIASTKRLAQLSRTVKKFKDQEFEPPNAKNNFVSRAAGARAALENLNPRLRILNRLEQENSYNQRMAISKANRKYTQQKAVESGAFSGKNVRFRTAKAAAERYTGRVQDILTSRKTLGQNKKSFGMKRTKVGEQFNLLGRSTPIKASSKTPSNLNINTYKVKRRRGKLMNS